MFKSGFFPNGFIEQPLNKYDGEFVDSIHTDVAMAGTGIAMSHADFFPNYGIPQPTCEPYNADILYNFLRCEFLYSFSFTEEGTEGTSSGLSP